MGLIAWIKGLFGVSTEQQLRGVDAETFIFIVIRESLGPMDRSNEYEDGLDQSLRAQGLGQATGVPATVCGSRWSRAIGRERVLYVVDRHGWLGLHLDVGEVEHDLEESDVASGEDVIIDVERTVFTTVRSDDAPRGFRLQSTGVVAIAALRVLRKYSGGDRLAQRGLKVVRSALPSDADVRPSGRC